MKIGFIGCGNMGSAMIGGEKCKYCYISSKASIL